MMFYIFNMKPHTLFNSHTFRNMSISLICVSCKLPLVPLNAKFCAQCGSPQPPPTQQTSSPKLCIYCKTQLPFSAIFCVSCGKPQPHPLQQDYSRKHCLHCKTLLPSVAAFCMKCSKPAYTQKASTNQCVVCSKAIEPGAQKCLLCILSQDDDEVQNDKKKPSQPTPNL